MKSILQSIPNRIAIVPAVLLFAALLPLPYVYYKVLRIVISASAVLFLCKTIARQGKTHAQWEVCAWAIVWAIVVIVFNPFRYITAPREVWSILNVAAGLLFAFVFAAWPERTSTSPITPKIKPNMFKCNAQDCPKRPAYGDKPYPYHDATSCEKAEKAFCEKVLRHCLDMADFHPQYPVNDGQYFIDFAVLFDNGRKIALEVESIHKYKDIAPLWSRGDNVNAQACLDRLLDSIYNRHNDLILNKGWEVYYFTWDDVTKNVFQTRDTLRQILASPPKLGQP